MDVFAGIVGISSSQAWSLVGALILAALFGGFLLRFWKVALVGVVAVLVIGFLHEHVKTNLPMPQADATAQPQYRDVVPQVIPYSGPPSDAEQDAIDAASAASATVAPEPELPADERAYLDKCAADGENSREECVSLFAEKRYVESEPASDAAASDAPPADQPANMNDSERDAAPASETQ
ncbi:hypothetical protein [Paraburkholderia bryophila]|uniref:Uncharacterized protein n=1 Tax=Paraburkholderia bryophila TaxID=420952 RepID=A0A7Y9WQD4_9BURK|nr:hypothetical protein [Paraburkholderia bryophila]NYH24658.1 hypothetical protein [Paraburkholderia bryophila]